MAGLRRWLWEWRPGSARLRGTAAEHFATRLSPTAIASRRGGRARRADFDAVRSFCLFVGHPRSGATLVGQLLNAHAEMVVSFELGALRYVQAGYGRDQLYWLVLRSDARFLGYGGRWAGYDYIVPGQAQGRYDRLGVVGDKHAADAAERLMRRPDLADRLRETVGVPVKVVHTVRDPRDNVATLVRRGGRTLDEAIDYYFALCTGLEAIRAAAGPDARSVHLERFIDEPGSELVELTRFLGVEADPGWLAACAERVFAAPRRTREEVRWTPEARARMREGIGRYGWLARYG